MADEQPVALVDDLQEPPDVLDVGVAEGEVVPAVVHPLAEALLALRQLGRGPDDDLTALGRKAFEPVLLDLALRVQSELALDPDLDPESLAVETVLVALVEAPQRLVTLKDVFQRPAPGGVHAKRLVRRHRAVDERPRLVASVLIAHPLEDLLVLPPLQNLLLQPGMIGNGRQRLEDLLHPSILGGGNNNSGPGVSVKKD